MGPGSQERGTISVRLPDGTPMEVARGTTVLALAEQIGARLAQAAVAAYVNGVLVDLSTPLRDDADVRLVTTQDAEGREVFLHSAAHLMAQAVQELFAEAKLAIGPALADRFYYDIDLPTALTEQDLIAVEQRMAEIVDRNLSVSRQELTRHEALELFAGNPYKQEIIRELPENETITIYRQGPFVDLCRGPHVPDTKRLGKHFKLLSLAGAYWRGEERRQMLQRIYGTAWPTKDELEGFLKAIEEAEARDHRKLGRELELFHIFDDAGPGLPFYLPKGAVLKRTIEQWLTDRHLERGYQIVWTPHLIKADMWKRSGHYDTGYPMYFTEIDEREYGVKPMNCPGHLLIYGSQTRSYRDLPLRMFELGTVYRHERAGVLHGLLRVRGFTQDDAHIFCTPEQLESELIGVLDFAREMLKSFGFEEFSVYLATRPDKSVGSDDVWERATRALEAALARSGLPYEVDPGGGAFYGPKIDIKLKDAIGRYWQGPTIQCDFNLPERFDLTYVGEDGGFHRPVMVHRVVLAGIERFIGILIEHYAGAFPTWLAPVQAVVIPIADRHIDYGRQVRQNLLARGIRAEIDERQERVAYKIRGAEIQRVPYMLVVGDREVQEASVSVRKRSGEDLGRLELAAFCADFFANLRG
ncbi:MAG TPA: threonine--tRNA ligase [Armatimonadota bacterium]|nr:threonine--tRNA ligase [Armatimonadota bacterium]